MRRSAKWRTVLAKVADRLVAAYGRPTLGNYRDPVKEIFFIVLSARTSEVLYKRASRNLFRRFRTIEAMAEARVSDVAKCIKLAGLGRKRSHQVVAIAKRLIADLGPRPQRKLRGMSAEEAYGYLVGLPGVGPKSALCVMMYSLDFDVFPVDAHIHRILCRMGAIGSGLKHYDAQKRLPVYVPEGRSRALHVALIVHGRRVCRPTEPNCTACRIWDLCKTGTKRHRTDSR